MYYALYWLQTPFIHHVIEKHQIERHVFCDLFAGTATVGHYFKQYGYRIISNDWLYTAHVLQYVTHDQPMTLLRRYGDVTVYTQ